MQYKIVMLVDGEFVTTTTYSSAALRVVARCLGFPPSCVCRSPAVRAELREQPMFEGLAGPMWDGPGADGAGVIRYEDHAANDCLSV